MSDLTARLNRPRDSIDLVDLPETDSAFEQFALGRMAAEQGLSSTALQVKSAQWQEIHDALCATRSQLPDLPVLLFRSESQWCGAVHATFHEVLGHAQNLLEVDQEDVLAATADGRCGMFLSATGSAGEVQYCLVVWW